MPTIRPPRPEPDELDAILAVHSAAFDREDEAQLVCRLHDAGDNAFELLAETHGQTVGHVLFSPVRIEHGDDGHVLGLAPVGVLPAWQRHGIGSLLIRQALEALRTAGTVRGVVVLGDPAYYTRFGFAPASRSGLHDIYDGGDAFMALALQSGGLDGYRGRVDYALAFDLLTD